ncbi:MAG: tRNA (N(6)-L-threonylcarbamoyladenosine(37)-C(2))-methylthiotransferase MtaB [Alphaproteobacteria bacterium]|nr:tRNA (N(6)-L-threonylcarbamoyladenosine(37)-C(2))-methylthiotransferase MtaB [Alphaproteobacteria bacterium]
MLPMKIVTFGCRMNTFESAVMARLGKDIPDDVIVVNTCAVTGEAERQCRQTIRKLKRENPKATVVVVGCAAQLNPEKYASMPEVDRVLGNHEKLNKEILASAQKKMVGDIEQPLDLPIVSDFEGRNRAFLQIQQGCDHQCTFCVVRFARGHNKGLPVDQVIEQAKAFAQAGFQEIVLTGADVASYPHGLVEITKCILDEVPAIKRLRYGSLDPAALKDDFVSLVKNYPQVMPHFHLSIQAGDNLILKRMGRRHSREDVIELTQKLRAVRSEVVFGADFITGFPTETQEQFENTKKLVEEAGLTHLHVFPYSERPGTPAAKMSQVPMQERRARAADLRSLGDKMYAMLLKKMLGQNVSVLVENDGMGWTENYLHVILSKNYVPGKIVDVTVKGIKDHALVG